MRHTILDDWTDDCCCQSGDTDSWIYCDGTRNTKSGPVNYPRYHRAFMRRDSVSGHVARASFGRFDNNLRVVLVSCWRGVCCCCCCRRRPSSVFRQSAQIANPQPIAVPSPKSPAQACVLCVVHLKRCHTWTDGGTCLARLRLLREQIGQQENVNYIFRPPPLPSFTQEPPQKPNANASKPRIVLGSFAEDS